MGGRAMMQLSVWLRSLDRIVEYFNRRH